MPLKIIRNDMTKVKADAIVNTVNPDAAGEEKLLEARKRIAILFVMLAAIMCGYIFKTNTYANSARRDWRGVDRAGVVVKGEDCPIEVLDEKLTFDLPEFPLVSYETAEKFLEYKGKVTAKYTFYNPADYKVTVKLVFPFGKYPDYGYYYDSSNNTEAPSNDIDKFDILVNDKKITKTLRYSFNDSYYDFDIDEDMKLLLDDFVKDKFYSPDLPVTEYVYEVRDVDEAGCKSAWAELSAPAFDGRRKYWLENGDSFESDDDGNCKIGLWAMNGREAYLYVIGEPVTDVPKWKFYATAANDAKEIIGKFVLKSTKQLSFKEFIFNKYFGETNVMETDGYNAAVRLFNQNDKKNGAIYTDINKQEEMLKALIRWYEYEITFNPGEKITNTIEAPMYPNIDKGYEPGVYDYTYLLSPASTWAKFGRLNIDINTPFYMFKDGDKGFTKTESGYNFKSNGLPKGELEFSLSESEKPENERNAYALNIILFFLLMILPYIVGGVVIVIIIIILVNRFGKR